MGASVGARNNVVGKRLEKVGGEANRWHDRSLYTSVTFGLLRPLARISECGAAPNWKR